jgi:hypothetical protein
MYNVTEWTAVPAELLTSGGAVRLHGYRRQPPNTLEVSDARGNTIVLLVVPIHTDPHQAHAVVTSAAVSGDVSTVDALLMISVKDRRGLTERDAVRERWDGQVRAIQPTGRDRRSAPRQDFRASSGSDSAPTGPELRNRNDYDK